MDSNIQPKRFWETVSNYSQNAMTHTEADFELSQVYGCIDSNQNEEVKDLFCFGVADGMREPISILEHIEGAGRVLPTTLIVNDISEKLFGEAKVNLVDGHWDTKIPNEITYFLGKIDEINETIVKHTKLRLGVIGVYSLGYFAEALQLYQSNSHIVGVKFNVYPVYLNRNGDTLVFEHGETIAFDINDLNDDIVTQIHNNVDKWKQLYAQCVYTTDNHFVSHYFNSQSLGQVMRHIFTDYDVEMEEQGNNGRYIVVKLRCAKVAGNGITLMTSLNNVLGNIVADAQMKSLEVLKGMID